MCEHSCTHTDPCHDTGPMVARLEGSVTRLEGHVERLQVLLHGNGAAGLVTRLDRLEQEAERRRWHMRALWTGLVAALAATGAKYWTS
jgi:hypothetical protein